MANSLARYTAGALLLIPVSLTAVVLWVFYGSLPPDDARYLVPTLVAPVTIDLDRFGIPSIEASTRLDAYRAMGFMAARDRLFQMDLLRRLNAGTLAEVLGEDALAEDRRHRILGFAGVAAAVANRLPPEQRAVLDAYAEGVNAYLVQLDALPFEFQWLQYRPAPWRVEDSVLVLLGMFDNLDLNEGEERMLSVMQRALPQDVVSFLTMQRIPYGSEPMDLQGVKRSVAIPVQALAALLRPPRDGASAVRVVPRSVGSNAWAVAGSRSFDGRAILANDMHLPLAVPNIWYRVQWTAGDLSFLGLTMPGTPLLIAGATGRLAWGLTHLGADVLDLIRIETDPTQPDRYRTPAGWRTFERRRERIAVRGASDVDLTIRQTIWGPVLEQPLLGQDVAVQWTALAPQAVDFAMLALDGAGTVGEGVDIANRAAGPALNVVLADASGHIAWTVMGRIPLRSGAEGAVARPSTEDRGAWSRFIAASELPRIIDPPGGIVVSANDRAYPTSYPYRIAHGLDAGYRAYRIRQRLDELGRATEAHMFALQLDTRAEPYRFYRDLVLELLSDDEVRARPELEEIRDYVNAWEGDAEILTPGLPLLVDFRAELADAVLSPFLGSCRDLEPDFEFAWAQVDVPLQRLLTERPPELNPDPGHHADWRAFLIDHLVRSAERLRGRFGVSMLGDIRWGRINEEPPTHPFSAGFPLLGALLDMRGTDLAGCEFCVRFIAGGGGATERLVVSPAQRDAGILHMPGGQSGHPLSSHYRDQHRFWADGLRLPLAGGERRHALVLVPTG